MPGTRDDALLKKEAYSALRRMGVAVLRPVGTPELAECQHGSLGPVLGRLRDHEVFNRPQSCSPVSRTPFAAAHQQQATERTANRAGART